MINIFSKKRSLGFLNKLNKDNLIVGIHADDEDIIEFQAFRDVNGHKGNIVSAIHIVLRGKEGNVISTRTSQKKTDMFAQFGLIHLEIFMLIRFQ